MLSSDKITEVAAPVDAVIAKTAILLEGTAATGNGGWLKFDLFKAGTIEITGLTGADVLKLTGTNEHDPTDASHGTQIGSDITANGFVSIDKPYRFIKLRQTALEAGAHNVRAVLHAITG